MKPFIAIILLLSAKLFAADTYMANRERQERDKLSFALNPETAHFHEYLKKTARGERQIFIDKIVSDKILHHSIKQYPTLSKAEQKDVLVKVFNLQIEAMGVQSPKLILGSNPRGGVAFFEFDPRKNSPGVVYLDFDNISQEPHPYAGLVLLIHETRHSFQFQHRDTLGYEASFLTQFNIFANRERLSFSDFTLLLHEYEAFQFANFVINRLTDGTVNIEDMGTIASQYDEQGDVLLDLNEIINSSDPFAAFNSRISTQTGIPLDTSWKRAIYEYAKKNAQHMAWGIGHGERNYHLTKEISKKEGVSVDDDALFVASFLHDIGGLVPFEIPGVSHEVRSVEVIAPVLAQTNFPMDKWQLVSELILGHVYSKPAADGLLSKAFRDADILDFLGAIGIGRIFAVSNELFGQQGSLEKPLEILKQFHQSLPAKLHFNSSQDLGKTRVNEFEVFHKSLSSQTLKGAAL